MGEAAAGQPVCLPESTSTSKKRSYDMSGASLCNVRDSTLPQNHLEINFVSFLDPTVELINKRTFISRF